MPIRALKVRTPPLPPRLDVPAPAALIRHQRPPVRLGHARVDKVRVLADRPQPVLDGEVGAPERAEHLRE